jgi:S-DNA-T family DNA segregation ATPase FtsK/SpoIIIE
LDCDTTGRNPAAPGFHFGWVGMTNKRTRSESSSTKKSNSAKLVSSLLERIQDRFEDLGVILTISLALLTILGLLDLTKGVLIDPWITFLRRWLGWGVWIIPVIFGYLGYVLLRRRQGHSVKTPWHKVIAAELFVIGLLAILTLLDGMSIPRAEEGIGGGLIGWGLATFLGDIIGEFASLIVFLILTLFTGLYAFQGVIRAIAAIRPDQFRLPTRQGYISMDQGPPVDHGTETATVRKPPRRRTRRLPREYRKDFQVPEPVIDHSVKPSQRDVRLPPYEIFDQGRYSPVSSKEINFIAGLIEKTMADFGLPVRVVDFKTGPAVTQFAVQPGYIESELPDGTSRKQKVRVSQISSLANDLALALSAPRVRIEAPVPGQSFVGIEVPNRKSSIVRLGPIMQSDAFTSIKSPLSIALGRDVAGMAVAADLASMPHLLIAGTTGSGKSVCITSIASSLVFNNSPEDLRLVMIDPKMVELVRFNGLPHLLGRVETELERIVGVLRWCMMEMDRRYKLLENAQARDIESYNKRIRRRKSAERMPRLIVMIDELADLMMMVPDQTEQTLVRLAQMARATGIHLIVATQRPSTDVVTGLIKANFPARISFAVASGIDSRVILDSGGAETLLGSGDMLFLSPEAAAPVRLQGSFVSDLEIERLINFWSGALDEDYFEEEEEVPWESELTRQAIVSDKDAIIERAIDLVRASGQASASMLQRRLRIGYPRAARLMDELEELGIIGRPQSGGRTREVLIGKDDDPLSPAEDDSSIA